MKSGSSGVCSSEPTSRNTSLRRGWLHGLGLGQARWLSSRSPTGEWSCVILCDFAARGSGRAANRPRGRPRPSRFPARATREHARHACHSGLARAALDDLIVGHGDGFADALFGGAGLPLQARADAPHRDLGRLLARGLPADAIHHQEDAAVRIEVQGVLVVLAYPARIAGARAPELGFKAFEVLRNSRNSTPARPMRAWSGTGASTLRSRFSASANSMLDGAFSPLMVVPSRLRSFRKNLPLSGSRRRRKCSRETSGKVSSLRSVQ